MRRDRITAYLAAHDPHLGRADGQHLFHNWYCCDEQSSRLSWVRYAKRMIESQYDAYSLADRCQKNFYKRIYS